MPEAKKQQPAKKPAGASASKSATPAAKRKPAASPAAKRKPAAAPAAKRKPAAAKSAPAKKMPAPMMEIPLVRIPQNPKRRATTKGRFSGGGCEDDGSSSSAFAPVGSQLGYATGLPETSQSANVPLCGSMAVASSILQLPEPSYQVLQGLDNGIFMPGTSFKLG